MTSFFQTQKGDFALYEGDARTVVPQLPCASVDMIFADPPYLLSNDGLSVQSGKPISVNKGEWDRSHGVAADAQFNYEWIKVCREKMSEAGTIWICGTFHNIFSVASVLTDLDFRILNAVTWQKTNPPPNLSCRFFKHSTEIILWARKRKKVAHYFNYDLMHRLAGGWQMTDVWRMPAIAPWEKACGKHPTQKPLALSVARRREFAARRADWASRIPDLQNHIL
jgi:site-specific DNA-methyltransferase (adenine-specific)